MLAFGFQGFGGFRAFRIVGFRGLGGLGFIWFKGFGFMEGSASGVEGLPRVFGSWALRVWQHVLKER